MSTAASPTPAAPRTQGSNGLGIAGFVVSLLGIITCGLLSPIGLLFSLLGLLKAPRGLAFAGAVLGALGTAFLALAGYGIVMGVLFGRDMAYTIQTANTMNEAAVEIRAYRTEHGAYPAKDEADPIISGKQDAWGNAVQYTLVSDEAFTLTAPGEDGQTGTEDDVTYDSATETFQTKRGDLKLGEIRDAMNEAAQKAAEEAAKQQMPDIPSGDSAPTPQQ